MSEMNPRAILDVIAAARKHHDRDNSAIAATLVTAAVNVLLDDFAGKPEAAVALGFIMSSLNEKRQALLDSMPDMETN